MANLPQIYFQRLLAISPDIVIAVDREGSIVFYNDGARRTLGYTTEELVDRHVQDLYPSLEEARSVMRAMRECDGTSKNFETALVAKNGDRIPVAISGCLIRDEDGVETGSIGFAKDLREIRHRDQLATLGELAVSLAHEINNPLEAIGNDLRLLAKFLVHHCSDEEFVVEGERFEAIERELGRIRETVERIESMASGGHYETREYLPGKLMTDLSTAVAPIRAGDCADGENSSLEGLRVLVVDDDMGVCRSIRDFLVGECCQVSMASGGLEALDKFVPDQIDLVLSDVVMPDMDGYDLYMELKERSPETPVVLMTAYYFDKDHVIKRSRIEGLQGVIFKKPIDPLRLKAILAETMREHPKPDVAR